MSRHTLVLDRLKIRRPTNFIELQFNTMLKSGTLQPIIHKLRLEGKVRYERIGHKHYYFRVK